MADDVHLRRRQALRLDEREERLVPDELGGRPAGWWASRSFAFDPASTIRPQNSWPMVTSGVASDAMFCLSESFD
jgi:hypothetical protein